MSHNMHFFLPKYMCLPLAYSLQRTFKNIHKQGEYGLNPVLLTDHVALWGENRNVKLNYFLFIVKREYLSGSDSFPFTVFEKRNYLKAGIKLVITQCFRS